MFADSPISDVRYAARALRKSPWFYTVGLLTVALAIATPTAAVSIFRFLNGPLPFPESQNLVMLWGGSKSSGTRPVSVSDAAAWTARALSLEQVVIARNRKVSFAGPSGASKPVTRAEVSGEFFSLLRLTPRLGRFLDSEDDRPGSPAVAVIGAQLWRRRFSGDPHVVGHVVLIDSRPFTVIGIAPEGFGFSYPGDEELVEVWVPLHTAPNFDRLARSRDLCEWFAMGRLAPGATLDSAQQELSAIQREASSRVRVQSLRAAVVAHGRRWSLNEILVGAALFLAVCVNMSGLLSIRAEARHAEFSVRAALGATRARLARLLLLETFLSFSPAIPLSALGTSGLLTLFRSQRYGNISPLDFAELRLDDEAWLLCIVLALLAGLLCGLPAAVIASRIDPLSIVNKGVAGMRSRRHRFSFQALLIITQIATAYLLAVVATGALDVARVSSFLRNRVVYTRLSNLAEVTGTHEQRQDLIRTLMQSIDASSSNVRSVAMTNAPPLSRVWPREFELEILGVPLHPPRFPLRSVVSPGYFATLGVPLRRGREFAIGDSDLTDGVAIISASMAQGLFPGQDPIGVYLRQPERDGQGFRRIVGVVSDMPREDDVAPAHEVYIPLAQSSASDAVIVVSAKNAKRIVDQLPGIVAAVNSGLQVETTRLATTAHLETTEKLSTSTYLVISMLLAFGLIGIGIYSRVSYTTALRTAEFGIRSALGAPPAAIVWLAVRGGLAWIAAGWLTLPALGSAAAWYLGKAGVSYAHDILTMTAWFVPLGVVGICAALLPAYRAVRRPPADALRCE